MSGMKRLVVEIPESQHKEIKARALLRGMSMRDYVLERLKDDNRDDYDMTDVTESVAEALHQVANSKKGDKPLSSAREVLNNLD